MRRARDAERGARGGVAQLGREQARVAPADLGQRACRGQARRDGDAQQVEHVGELGLHRAAAAAGAAAEPHVGREEAGGGRGREQHDAGPAGRRGEQDQRAGQAGERRRRP